MPDAGNSKKRRKKRLKWSNLYTFSCLSHSHKDEASLSLGGEDYSRVVYINDLKENNAQYPSNWVSTTKYSLLTFLPKALFEQFRRVANLYFLLGAAVSVTPLSPFSALSLIAPLVFVVGVSMVKEAIEDWHRYLQDKEVNNRMTLLHKGDGIFSRTEWKNVRAGDILKVLKDDFFPADLLLLSSCVEDGICYVETMNLDGETNLKMKRSLECTLYLDEEEKFKSFHASIISENPNPQLYSFIGNLRVPNKEVQPLGPQQILLRDSKLRNTDYIFGAVIFTGHDTKVMQNATPPPSKRSNIEKRMDLIIYFLFAVLVLISAVGSIALGIITWKWTSRWWYLKPDDANAFYNPKKPFVASLLHFITALILYGYLIPISLYVSIEIVKVTQAMFINQDLRMYYEKADIPAQARTSNLNEELGQVNTILSDKTGTLTCNQMDFVKCTIAGTSYGKGITEVEIAAAQREGKIPSSHQDSDQNTENEISGAGTIKGFNFTDKRLMNNNWIQQPCASEIQMFLRILAVCHTVVPDEDESGMITYEAESPDEGAFVLAARELGFEFFKRTQSSVWVKETDPKFNDKVTREYKVLQLLEFTSARKRMSVVVKDEEDNILLFCKGADSIMFERLGENGRKYMESTEAHLVDYAAAGLRTLAITYRRIEPSEYELWNSEFMKAKMFVGVERDVKLDEASDLIERDLMLIGATAVEDKLQKGVPECISKLAQAGIKIWVLTGDKLETAINIGLLHQDMVQMIISLENEEVKRAEASGDKQLISKVSLENVKQQIVSCKEKLEEINDTVSALIIDGKAVNHVLDKDLEHQLMEISTKCASVICCRVSPKQKAMITNLVKRNTRGIILGVGDGANDVGMIQEAHVGVGIAGVEGMQATMASDFSIAQFRYLEQLLLIHGSWCYKRIAHMICYFFYKNILFGFTLFYYEVYTAFSGQPAYNDWYMSLFNVFFTSLPVLALGVFEQDISARFKLLIPQLYKQGIKNMYFSWRRILLWMALGVASSVIIFFFTLRIVNPQAFRKDGRVSEANVFGAILYTCVVWTVNCQLALLIRYFTLIQHVFIWGSIGLWYLFLVLYGYIPPTISTTAYKVLIEACGPAPSFWLILLLVTIAALVPSFLFKSIQQAFCPRDDQIILEWFCLQKKKDSECLRRVPDNKDSPGHVGNSDNVRKNHWHRRAFRKELQKQDHGQKREVSEEVEMQPAS